MLIKTLILNLIIDSYMNDEINIFERYIEINQDTKYKQCNARILTVFFFLFSFFFFFIKNES